MNKIAPDWRTRWCGGEYGDCACMDCVQIGNRAVMAEIIQGKPYRGDQEYISEERLMQHEEVYAKTKLTRDEWENWMIRNGHQIRKQPCP